VKFSRPVGIWLLCLAALVFMMAVIGAITRLTESGLSIVEWQPVQDILPPSNAAAWQHAYQIYSTTPQYRYVTHGLTMDQFQNIYFWEWLHRAWARVVLGTAFAVPFLYFAVTRHLSRRSLRVLVLVLVLGGLQGFVGWYMVRSGLEQRPSVSHYRLALHLAMAMAIYVVLFWNGLSLAYPLDLMRAEAPETPKLRRHAWVALAMIAVTMTWGAFVAGLKAGKVYNTFPLMGGKFIPGEWDFYQPVIMNFVMNPVTVQFTHRYLAMTTAVVVIALAWRAWKAKLLPKSAKDIATALMVVAPGQAMLGIVTLLYHVPVRLGAAHQAGAITLLSLVIAFLFVLRRAHAGAMLTRVLERPKEPQSGMALSGRNTQNQDSTEEGR
jgi:cytochrome c oxidase assembly protein subunit 15